MAAQEPARVAPPMPDSGHDALAFIVHMVEELAFEQARSPASGSGWLESFFGKMKEFNKKHGIKSEKYTM